MSRYGKGDKIPDEEVMATVFPWRSMKGVSIVLSDEAIRKVKAGETKIRGIWSNRSIDRLRGLMEKENPKAYSKVRFSKPPTTTVDTHEESDDTFEE